jgi:hypothetical protein
MNICPLYRIIVLLCAAVAFTGCSTLLPHKSQSVAGTWKNSAGTVWTLKPDGKFEVEVKAAHPFRTWGTYTVSGDTLTIYDKNPKAPRACREPGVYHFQRSGDTLQFTLVKDACRERARQVPLAWHLQKR